MKKNNSGIERFASFIVDKRNGFFLLFFILAAFSVVSRNWVVVNNELSDYLAEDTETRQGIDIMANEFKTFGTARVMVDNITLNDSYVVLDTLKAIEGVDSVAFDESNAHYKNASALFDITFAGELLDQISIDALSEVENALSERDTYIYTEVGNPLFAEITTEINIILIVAAIIIVVVLLFTSKTYAEIPVLILVFVFAALLNIGSNFIFGEISFVSNSIAVILQLALALDYAIILCHRYTEERVRHDARTSTIKALAKSMPEIMGSCLTTICGLAAMMFMQFRIGFDMGLVLIKAIVISIMTVFFLMPGLLMLFSRLIDKTPHKSFIPNVSAIGKLAVKTRFVMPPLFLCVLVLAFYLSFNCPYAYGITSLTTIKQNESQIAQTKINDTFGSANMMALVIPSGQYDNEKMLISDIEKLDGVDRVVGLAGTEALGGYTLTDNINARNFADIASIDISASRLLYTAYAVKSGDYGKIISNIDEYKVPLIDVFFFVYEQKDEGYFELGSVMSETIDELYNTLTKAKVQLQGENFSRILIYSLYADDTEEAKNQLEPIHNASYKYYDSDSVYIVGNTVSQFDLSKSFAKDNVIISILSAVLVMIVLLFTFKSAGVPILLIIVIQGSIWINFSFPTLMNAPLFFMSYLVVSSIQMGANIDYAIVITNRYNVLKNTMEPKKAIIEALTQSFPTIITSGTMLVSAGFLIGTMSSNAVISSIGLCLGRGTIISILLVLLVLPQILVLGDKVIRKTAFSLKPKEVDCEKSGDIRVNGRVRGRITGEIDADVKGVIKGTLNGFVESDAEECENEEK